MLDLLYHKHFLKITFLKRKLRLRLFYNHEIIISTKKHLYMDGKFLKLFCIENDFAKCFAKFGMYLFK